MAEENLDSNVQQALKNILDRDSEPVDKYKINLQFSANCNNDRVPKPLHMALKHATKNQGISKDEKLPRTKEQLAKVHQKSYQNRANGELDVTTLIKSSSHRMYWVIIEDKDNYSKKVYPEQGKLNLCPYYTKHQAVNGAVYYAKCIKYYKNHHRNDPSVQDEIPDHIIAIGCTPSKYGKNKGYHVDPYVIETNRKSNYIIHTPRMKELDGDAETCFGFLKPDKIDEFYDTKVYNKASKDEVDRPDINKIANELNLYMENLQIEGNDKAPLVAAILLGIKSFYYEEKDEIRNLNLDPVNGIMEKLLIDGRKAGDLLNSWIKGYLKDRIDPSIDAMMKTSEFKSLNRNDQFDYRDNKKSQLTNENKIIDATFNSKDILKNGLLNDDTREHYIDKNGTAHSESPLGKMVEDLNPIFTYINKSSSDNVDVLGRFYSNFVKYNNNDGNDLGIVITPFRVTKIMVKLLDIQPKDIVLDPVAGTGTFLVAAMQEMLNRNNDDSAITDNDIKNNHLISIEKRSNMYAVLVSNMLLRGSDGNSNLILGDFFDYYNQYSEKDDEKQETKYQNEWHDKTKPQRKSKSGQVFKKKLDDLKKRLTMEKEDIKGTKDTKDTTYLTPPTKILMNPPYSLKKKAKGASEIDFVMHALKILRPGGILAAIIPQSIFVSGGSASKTYAAEKKRWILNHCTVRDVITMNPQTFYPVNAQPVIVIIQKKKNVDGYYSNLIDYSRDGYKVIPKKGLIPQPLSLQEAEDIMHYHYPSVNEVNKVKKDASKKIRLTRFHKVKNCAKNLLTYNDIKYRQGNDMNFKGYVKCIHTILTADAQDTQDIKAESIKNSLGHNETVNDRLAYLDRKIPFVNRISFEWIFGANYTNPTPPSENDFKRAVADYLGFKSAEILKGRSYLFNHNDD